MKNIEITSEGSEDYMNNNMNTNITNDTINDTTNANGIDTNHGENHVENGGKSSGKIRVISGVQPTSIVHIGNYLGAIKRFVKYQDDSQFECLFFMANLHSITAGIVKDLHKNTLLLLAIYLACGLNENKVTVFAQSDIPEITEIAWVFSCVTPMGWMNRMTQYKSKSEKVGEMMGLYSYPVLMAADILSYKANIVPVGDDQVQHIELVRNIAEKFNFVAKKEVFNLPKATLSDNATRIMSLNDPTKKMSKSDENPNSRIHLTDDNETIKRKISRAVTDSSLIEDYSGMVEKERLGAMNLMSILAEFSNQDIQSLCNEYVGENFAKLKSDITEIVTNAIRPIREKVVEYMNNEDYLVSVLKNGANEARKIAAKTKKEVYDCFDL